MTDSDSSDKGAKMSEVEKKLFDAITNKGSIEEIKVLLCEDGVNVDCLDDTGMSPIQHAAFRGRTKLCELLLARGADVNSTHHENNYSCLMFAALSGNTEVTRLMLEAGARTDHINSVNRTATQMAAFVGQHQVVSLIKNFCPAEKVEYYTMPQGLEKEPKLPPALAQALHTMINMPNLHPVALSLYLKEHKGLIEESKKVVLVLDRMCEAYMKSKETSDVMAVKTHYLMTLISHASDSANDKKDNLDTWIKCLLRGRDGDGYQEFMERFIRESWKSFPFSESELFEQMVRNVASVRIGDDPTALSILTSGINGQHYIREEETCCSTCGKPKAENKCSSCKMMRYCKQQCQKLHWFTHKKFCKQLAVEYIRLEKGREKLKQADLEREMREKAQIAEKKSKENDESTEKVDESEEVINDTSQQGYNNAAIPATAQETKETETR